MTTDINFSYLCFIGAHIFLLAQVSQRVFILSHKVVPFFVFFFQFSWNKILNKQHTKCDVLPFFLVLLFCIVSKSPSIHVYLNKPPQFYFDTHTLNEIGSRFFCFVLFSSLLYKSAVFICIFETKCDIPLG